jgi:predicted deacylase
MATDKAETMALAEAFGAPVIITSRLRDGSLRLAAQEQDVDVLLYEAGEGLRFDELSARIGVSGILRVMLKLGMVQRAPKSKLKPVLSSSSSWLRAPAGGLLRTFKGVGEAVDIGDVLGIVADPFGDAEMDVTVNHSGVIIGRTNLPVVNEGDALFHIAVPDVASNLAAERNLTAHSNAAPMFDEDEII